jgi:hypothetical protein
MENEHDGEEANDEVRSINDQNGDQISMVSENNG